MENILFIALVIGLTQVMKKAGLKTKLVPLVSLLFGLGLSFLYTYSEGLGFNWLVIQEGLIVGLSACGLYSGTKATFK